eukprot:CAMPEP_0177791968 /NCGR_PEP_ID=MMETSP0491_2-20121128/24247_1 /TAXON_ID=63592 /ORGANISM="Tetraselmis chuii, Strain PLY429" /LENGTH=140 /DNA_ID=CAMNT_0019314297 /DNA_START=260 /DNA_END=679 /DNA_ORIENTATION=-
MARMALRTPPVRPPSNAPHSKRVVRRNAQKHRTTVRPDADPFSHAVCWHPRKGRQVANCSASAQAQEGSSSSSSSPCPVLRLGNDHSAQLATPTPGALRTLLQAAAVAVPVVAVLCVLPAAAPLWLKLAASAAAAAFGAF